MGREQYNEISYALTNTTYNKDINVLPDIRDDIVTAVSGIDWTGFEAAIAEIEIRSGSSFSVQLNSETVLGSIVDGSEYVVRYAGSIDRVVFDANTSVTYIWAAYFRRAAEHVSVTLESNPSGATMTMKNWAGETVAVGTNSKYDCNIYFPYVATAAESGIYEETSMIFRAKEPSAVVVNRDISRVASIAVTTPPTKTSYYEGETLDLTGIAITATLENAATTAVTDDCTFSPADETVLTTGDTTVTVSYTDPNGITRTTTQAITVSAIELSSIAVATPPTKTAYTTGEELTMAGLVITATMNNSETETINYGAEGLSYSPTEGTVITESGNVTITYTDNGVSKTATQAITFA